MVKNTQNKILHIYMIYCHLYSIYLHKTETKRQSTSKIWEMP